MKISLVHSFYRSSMPSGENFTVELQKKALENAGYEVQMVASYTDDKKNSKVYPLKAGLNVVTGSGESPMDRLIHFKPDIVHVHNLFPNISTKWLRHWPGSIVATLHNFRPMCANGLLFRNGRTCVLCPDSGQHHGVIHGCYRNSALATLPIAISNQINGTQNNPVLNRANRLIVLSERSRRTYLENGIEASRMQVVPNFIEPALKTQTAPLSENTWLYAGRLTPEKGILRLLEDWPAEKKITIIGSGPLAERISQIAARRPELVFLGSMERRVLLERMSQVKGVIIPSQCAENLPTVYLEALAAGRPVIAREGNSAADDVSEWAPSLTYLTAGQLEKSLHSAEHEHPTYVEKSHLRYETLFTEKAWIQTIGEVYADVLQHNPEKFGI